MSLRDRADNAKKAQTFKAPAVTEDEAKPKPRPKKKPKPAAKRKTANELAREMAEVDEAGKKPKDRRASIAQLVVELTPEQKAELWRSAKANGRTLKAEVIDRLGFAD